MKPSLEPLQRHMTKISQGKQQGNIKKNTGKK